MVDGVEVVELSMCQSHVGLSFSLCVYQIRAFEERGFDTQRPRSVVNRIILLPAALTASPVVHLQRHD